MKTLKFEYSEAEGCIIASIGSWTFRLDGLEDTIEARNFYQTELLEMRLYHLLGIEFHSSQQGAGHITYDGRLVRPVHMKDTDGSPLTANTELLVGPFKTDLGTLSLNYEFEYETKEKQ